MTLGRSVTLVVALAVATTASVAAWHVLSRWGEGPGPRLRRDCTSLVDTVLAEADSEEELEKWLRGSGEYGRYEAEKKAYDAKWKEIEASPEYQPAWEAVFVQKRDKAIKDCIVSRARREGVSIRPASRLT